MNEHEDELEEFDFTAWSAEEPPDDFADQVMARVEAKVATNGLLSHSRSRARLIAGVAIGITVAAAIGLVVWPRSSEGSFSATEREELELRHAVLVAEAGASGVFRSDGGETRVRQDSGNVFYRVDKGTDFTVDTPAGAVAVRGTCFRVEIQEMETEEMRIQRQTVAGAAIAATLTAVVTVSVYEGRVAVANDHGEVELEAGQRSSVLHGQAPDPATDLNGRGGVPSERPSGGTESPLAGAELHLRPAEDLSLEELRSQHEALLEHTDYQVAEVQRLREQMRELEVRAGLDEGLFYPTSSHDLQLLAERCEVRVDQPPVMGIEPSNVGEHAETLGLTAAETEVMQEAINRLHGEFIQDLRRFYIEATGDVEGAGSLSPDALLAEMQDKAPPTTGPSLLATIARERAGLAAPPSVDQQLPAERAFRQYTNIGNEFQSLLAQSLGAERADELRRIDSGWPWGHSRIRGCGDRD